MQGVDNLVTRLASCCHPVPGDAIVGYITRGYGVTIHRRECHKVITCATECPERLAEVTWDLGSGGSYPMEIQIIAFDHQELLRDIATVLNNEKLTITATRTPLNREDRTAKILVTFETPDVETLNRALNRIQQLPNVFNACRITH